MRKITSTILVGMLLSMGFIGLFSVPVSAGYIGYITGTVTDAGGVGLYGTTVYYTDAYGHTSSTTTNTTGGYNLSGLVIGVYYVEVSMSTYLPTSKIQVTVNADQVTSNVNFTLLKSGWINGTVTNENGALVTSGTVYAYDATSSTQIGYSSIGSNGAYNISSKLYTGNYLIYASLSGYPAQPKYQVSVTPGQGTTCNIGLVPGGSIVGFVKDQDGNPIVSSLYDLYARRDGSSSYNYYNVFNFTTGEYKISSLETGKYTVYASFYYFESKTIYDVNVTKGQITYLNITLTRKAYVQGYVKNAAGSALSYAYVQLVGTYKSDYTDSYGYYNITDVTPGNYTIKSTYSGYPDHTALISVASGEGKWYNITQSSGAYITGYLKDSDGNTLSVSYEIRYKEQNETTTHMIDGYSSSPYNITGLSLGRYNLTAKVSGYAQASIIVDVTALQGYTNQNITLPTGGYITGTLNISDGTSITSASGTIYAYDADGVSYSDSPYYGAYNITGLKTSTYRLEAVLYVYSGGYKYYVLPYIENVSITQGVGLTNYNLTLYPEGKISGNLTSANDNYLYVYRYNKYGKSAETTVYTYYGTGTFSFGQLPNGTYRLEVQNHPELTTNVTVNLNATTYVNLTVSGAATGAGTTISGYITNSSGPISGAAVKARALGSTTFSTATTNATGYYQITSLSGNAYYIEATADGYCPGTLRDFVVLQGQANTGANITLTKSATINGTITSNSEPVYGATITVYEGDAYYPTEGYTSYAVGSVSSTSNGSYIYTAKLTWSYSYYSTKNMPLYPGSYRVVVTKDGYIPAQATVTITTQGETVQKNFVLTPANGSIAGYILGKNNVPVGPSVYVYAKGANTGTVKNAYTNSSGAYNITNLPLDDYALSVETSGYETSSYVLTTLNVSITTTGYATNQNITLIPKYYVEGYITDASTGNPVASATVYIYKDTYTGSYAGYTSTRETGYYILASMDSFGYYGMKITANGYITKYLPLYITSSNILLNTTLTKGSTITGTVCNDRGILITSGSVYVYLKTLNGVEVGSDYSLENGVYSISSIPAGTYRLEVSSYTFGTQAPVEVTVGSAELKYQNLTIKYGYLEGYVRDSSNNSIAGATVSMYYESTTTNSNGYYLLSEYTTSGSYTVTAKAKGYVGSTSNVSIVVGTTTYCNITLASSGAISGYVFDQNNQPLADIYGRVTDTTVPTDVTYTNSTGYYIIDSNLGTGTYSVVFGEGSSKYLTYTANISVTAGATTSNQNVTLVLGGSISGYVTNAYGAPRSSIYVYAYNLTNTTTYVTSAYTDSNGFYNITKLPAGTYMIKVLATNTYKETSSASISVTLGQTTANQNMTIALQYTVSGFVSKSSGEPVYNINVKAYNTSTSFYQTSDTTTISGYYNLKHLDDGTTYNIKTEGYYYSPFNTLYGNATLVLGTQTTNTTQNITMSKSAILFGYVTYNGAAMSGAYVRLFFNNSELTYPYYNPYTTGTNGLYFFTMQLKTGTYTVVVEKTGYAMTSQNITLTEGVATFLNISMVKSARIHGFLLDANGVSVTTETIAVYVTGQNQYLPLLPIVNDMKELGFYSISSKLIAGTYQLYATILGECVWLNVTVATGESVIANLTSTRTMGVGNITGFVKDQNGTTVAGATVSYSRGGIYGTTTTNSSGAYTFTDLTIGDYSLWASKEEYGCGEANATVEANKTTWANITLLPHIYASVVGYVNDTSGNAIVGATVTLSKTGITPRTATTNATGYYNFSNVVFGAYNINATKTGYNISSTTVNVTTSTTYWVNFTLAAVVTTGTLKGFVKTSAGVAIQGATVAIMSIPAAVTTDNDGMYRFDNNITAGTYTLTIAKTGYRSETRPVIIIAGETCWLNITLLGETEADTIAPTITITYPIKGALLSSKVVNVTGMASDSGGNVSGVWINTDNQTWTIACAVEEGIWYRTIALSEGANTIYVKANDTSNNIAYASVTVTVDTTLPTIAITSHATNTVVTTETINLAGTASDNVGLETVLISKDNKTWTAATGTTTWNATVTLSVGVNTIYVKTTDTSGNSLVTSIKVARQEEIKTASPTAPIVVNLTVGVPYAFKIGAEEHKITVTNVTSTTAVVEIQSNTLTVSLTVGEAWLGDTNGNGQNDMSATLQSTNVATGTANVSISAVQEDLTKPTVTVTDPATTDSKTTSAKVTIKGTANDTGTGVKKVEISVDGGNTWISCGGTNVSWTADVDLKEGLNTIKVRAADNVNNVGDAVTITITREKPPAPPKKGWFLPGFELLFLLAAVGAILAIGYRRKK
jgi:hypothetical protein